MKYIVFSYDDGTVHDLALINLMNKYKIIGTFNLNSNLSNYTWKCNGTPIVRPNLKDTISWYEGHDVCSHSATHPRLNDCDSITLYDEVFESKEDLEALFSREIDGYVIPFDTFSVKSLEFIEKANYKYCRVPYIMDIPTKVVQVLPDALTFRDDIYKVVKDFIENGKDETMFVVAGHPYEYYLDNSLDKIEKVFELIANQKDVKSVSLKEALIATGRL